MNFSKKNCFREILQIQKSVDVFSAKQITFFSLALLNIGNMNAVLAFDAVIGGQFPCLCLVYLFPRGTNMYEET